MQRGGAPQDERDEPRDPGVEVVRDRLTRDFVHRAEWGDYDVASVELALGARFRDVGFKNGAVDAKFAELREAGYRGRREPWLTSFGAYMCMVDDPDGNTVLITAG